MIKNDHFRVMEQEVVQALRRGDALAFEDIIQDLQGLNVGFLLLVDRGFFGGEPMVGKVFGQGGRPFEILERVTCLLCLMALNKGSSNIVEDGKKPCFPREIGGPAGREFKAILRLNLVHSIKNRIDDDIVMLIADDLTVH